MDRRNIDESLRKPRRTKGTPFFVQRNYYTIGLIAAAGFCWYLYELWPASKKLRQAQIAGKFDTPTYISERFQASKLAAQSPTYDLLIRKLDQRDNAREDAKYQDDTKPQPCLPKSEKISKYFKSIAKSSNPEVTHNQESEGVSLGSSLLKSPYKNCLTDIKSFNFNDSGSDANDFKTPTAIGKVSKIVQLKPPKMAKQPKKRASKKKKPPLRKTTDALFRNHDDVNPEHLQMALALSESSYQSENVSDVTKTDATHQSTEEKAVALKLALEHYGFRSGKTQLAPLNKKPAIQAKKIVKNSRYRFITPVLYIRSEEEREALISSKISLILSKNSGFSTNFVNETLTMFSESLRKVWRKSRIFKINSLSLEEFNENTFRVKQLSLSPPKPVGGGLLKNWGGIAGRDVSPTREIINVGDFTRESRDNESREGESRDIDHVSIVSSVMASRGLDRSISPDLFSSEEENEDFSKDICKEIVNFDNKERQSLAISKSLEENGNERVWKTGNNEDCVEEFYDLTQSSEEIKTEADVESSFKGETKSVRNEEKYNSSKDDRINDEIVNEKFCDKQEAMEVESYPEDFEKNNYETIDLSESPEATSLGVKESSGSKCNIKGLNNKRKRSLFRRRSSIGEDITNKKQLKKPETRGREQNSGQFEAYSVKYYLTESSEEDAQKEDRQLSQQNYFNRQETLTEDLKSEAKSKNSSKARNQDAKSLCRSSRNCGEEGRFSKGSTPLLGNDRLPSTSIENCESLSTKDYFDKAKEELCDLTQSSEDNVKELFPSVDANNDNENLDVSHHNDNSHRQQFDFDMSFTRECYDWPRPLDEPLQVSFNVPQSKDTSCPNVSKERSLETSSIEGKFDDVLDVCRKGSLSQESQESILISDDELNYSNTFSTPNRKPVPFTRSRSSLYELSEEDEEELCLPTSPKIETNHIKNLKNNLSSLDDSLNDVLNKTNVLSRLETQINEVVAKTSPSKLSSRLINTNNDGTPERTLTSAAKSTPDNGFILKTSNVTPMANFGEMDTPKVVKELQKFGVKPLKRQRGIKMLKYIYESTHPLVGPPDESSDDESDKRVVKKRKESHRGSCTQISGDVVKDNEIEELVFERTQSKKIQSCRIPLQVVWHNFVADNPEIRENILMYEPLQLEVLHSMLKEQGFKFNLQDLLTFLDKKCVTIRTNQGQSGSRRRH